MKIIIITGASRGIGLATAKKFLAEGWRVVGTYLNKPPPINSQDFISIRFDQGNSESIRQTAEEIKKIAPNIDALVNNAAIILDRQDITVNLEKVRKTFEVDLFGLINFTEQLLPLMSAGAHIVNIDSQYGSFSFPIDDQKATAYRLAKAALNMYTRTLAFRLEPQAIIVSSLDPGWVKTDMGYGVATDTEKPDREPEQPAEEIYKLVTTVTESGHFWRFGEKRQW